MWEIRLDWIVEWLDQQDDKTLAGVYAALELLERQGPALGRPLVDTLRYSKMSNLKELRPASAGVSEIRILFAFDPWRRAVMLLAGDKRAGLKKFRWSKWYRRAIPEAEKRYAAYLKSEEGKD